jgi:hypothetical protein
MTPISLAESEAPEAKRRFKVAKRIALIQKIFYSV